MISIRLLYIVASISAMTVILSGCDNSASGAPASQMGTGQSCRKTVWSKKGNTNAKSSSMMGYTASTRAATIWRGYPASHLPLNHILAKIDNDYGIYKADGTVVCLGIEVLCVRGPYCLFYSASDPHMLQVLHCYDDDVELYMGEPQIQQIWSVFKIDETAFVKAASMVYDGRQLLAQTSSFLFAKYNDDPLKQKIKETTSWSKKSEIWPNRRIVNFGRVSCSFPVRSIVSATNHSTEPLFIEKFEAEEPSACSIMTRIGTANEKSVWKEVFNAGNKTRLSISPGESIDLLFVLEADKRHSGPFFDVIRMTPSDTSIPISFVLYGEITTDDENNETLTESN